MNVCIHIIIPVFISTNYKGFPKNLEQSSSLVKNQKAFNIFCVEHIEGYWTKE